MWVPERFGGMMVATLCHFDSLDRVDVASIAIHADRLIAAGVDALCPCGTTGEMLFLSAGEKVRVVEATCRAVAGRVPVLAGVWATTVKQTTFLAEAAESAGADAVFLPTPVYYPADDEVICNWYRAVHEATSLPVFAYNIPAYAANCVSAAAASRLAGEGTIAGIKDSTGKREQILSYLESVGPGGCVLAASDSSASTAREIGAHGFISAIANVWPSTFVKIWQGDISLQSGVDRARTLVKKHGGIPALKYLVSKTGIGSSQCRLPLCGLSDDAMAELDTLLIEAPEIGLR